jgi:hypothetical protein
MNTHIFTAALRHGLAARRGTKLLLCAAGAAAIASTALGSPASAITGVTGTGTTTCSAGWNGVMTFNPALKTGGTATSVVVAVKASFTGCTGGTPTPTGGTYIAKGVVSGPGANNCANWFAAPLAVPPLVTFNQAPLDGNVSWSPATINSSNASFTAMRIFTGAANRLLVKLSPPGTSLVTGSYAPTASLALRVVPSQPVALADCGTATGLTQLKIVPTAPPNHISHGSW